MHMVTETIVLQDVKLVQAPFQRWMIQDHTVVFPAGAEERRKNPSQWVLDLGQEVSTPVSSHRPSCPKAATHRKSMKENPHS